MPPDPTAPPPETSAAPDARAELKARNLAAAVQDASLVRQYLAGDESAFTEIVRRHHPRIRTIANRILRNHGDAEEVAQDTFLRAHRGLASFRGECSLAVWLHCIALNLARNRYGFNLRRRRHVTLSLENTLVADGSFTLADAMPDESAAPLAAIITSEFVALVAAGMELLEPRQREILLMRTKLNLSYEEIAVSLDISIGTVKSRIARARECLRTLLPTVAPEFTRKSSATDFFEFKRPPHIPAFVAG